MILDKSELDSEDTFEEMTLNHKGHLSFIWILAGIIGFIISIFVIYLMIKHESSNINNENLFIFFISISGVIFFGLMAFWGFKSRDILNSSNKNSDIQKIPKYGLIIWLLIAIYTILIWAMTHFVFGP